jgi:hypothetical protein
VGARAGGERPRAWRGGEKKTRLFGVFAALTAEPENAEILMMIASSESETLAISSDIEAQRSPDVCLQSALSRKWTVDKEVKELQL